ncbi:MAG TPA: FtsX-like permease family protein, partial [Bacteroidetes bacterium]|nr:FtsX-like permease family protein [Bacteroidota bacterium]
MKLKRVVKWKISLYQVMNMESWVVYCLLTLILLIAGFNILGSLVMLVLDKTKDIFILRSIGVTDRMIRWIFWSEGMMFSGVG